MPDRFEITGNLDGERVTVEWEDGVFVRAPEVLYEMVAHGEQVALTPTGPFFDAAARPAEVALVTARDAFDAAHANLVLDAGAEALLVALHDEYAVPEGAVA